jgi:4'-phosphopantetheinyl transferase EntD
MTLIGPDRPTAAMIASMAPGIADVTRLLAERLGVMAGGRVTVGARAIDPGDEDLLIGAERAVVVHAIPERRAEFATGRVLLRELLETCEAIAVRPDRTPALPAGFVGSLAHDRDYAIAAVCRDPAVRAIGVDIEPWAEMDAGTAEIIRRPEEAMDPVSALVMKEASYKAWSGLGGPLLESHDIHLVVNDTAGLGAGRAFHEFDAAVAERLVLHGRYADVMDRWIAIVVHPEAGEVANSWPTQC